MADCCSCYQRALIVLMSTTLAYFYTQTHCIYCNPPPSQSSCTYTWRCPKNSLWPLRATSRALMSSRCTKIQAIKQFTACLHWWDTRAARHTLYSHLINETGDQTEAQFSVYTQDGWYLLGTIVFTVWWHWSEVGMFSVFPLGAISASRIFPAALWVRQQSNDWLTPGFRDGLLWYALLANLMRSMQQRSSG